MIIQTKIYFYRTGLQRQTRRLRVSNAPQFSRAWGGVGMIQGEGVGIVTVDGKAQQRRLWLFARTGENLRLVADTWSDKHGRYAFKHLNTQQSFLIMATDPHYDPIAYDHVKPHAP